MPEIYVTGPFGIVMTSQHWLLLAWLLWTVALGVLLLFFRVRDRRLKSVQELKAELLRDRSELRMKHVRKFLLKRAAIAAAGPLGGLLAGFAMASLDISAPATDVDATTGVDHAAEVGAAHAAEHHASLGGEHMPVVGTLVGGAIAYMQYARDPELRSLEEQLSVIEEKLKDAPWYEVLLGGIVQFGFLILVN